MLSLPRWDRDRLNRDRLVAERGFREAQMKASLDLYLRAFDIHADNLSRLLHETADLHRLRERAADIVADRGLLAALSGVAAPPISVRELQTLAGVPRISSAALRVDPTPAVRIVETVLTGLDSHRFPWIPANRHPTDFEKHTAIQSSSAVLATLQARVARLPETRSRQAEDLHNALLDLGLRRIQTRAVTTTIDSPRPGEFCRESLFAGRGADFLVGLWDERLLTLECRASLSPLDSARRLRHEAEIKVAHWTSEYGTQTVAAIVLTGFFRLPDLLAIQGRGIGLFWSHEISALTDWIAQTRTP